MSKFLSPTGRAELNSETGPYPFSIAKANALLSSHGWTVVPGGTTTCTDPAKCGPGIPKGAWPLTRRPALVRECAA